MDKDTTAKLTWFWNSAYPGVAKYIPFERIANKAWKEANPDTCKEIGSIGVMHLDNLFKTLKTEQGREYYAKTLDLPSAISVDLDNTNQHQPTTMEMQEILERTFLVQCSKEQLVALGNWMRDNGIYFNKCSDKLNEAAHKESFPAAEAKEDNGTVRPLGADANCSHATTMTQKNSSQSGTDNPSSSPSQKQEASDSTESISPSSAQHGNALTEGGESASAKNLDNFRRILTLLARFSDQVYRPATSEWVEVPRSISFERILKQSSGSSTMPHSTSCATSSCPKQTEDGTHSLTNSQDSERLALSKSRCKELARLYSSALALMWGNNNVLTKQGLEEILSITEYHLEKHKRESTTYENQLRLAKDFRKRMLHDGTN